MRIWMLFAAVVIVAFILALDLLLSLLYLEDEDHE